MRDGARLTIPVQELRELLAKLPDGAEIGACVVKVGKVGPSVIIAMSDQPNDITGERYTDLWTWRLNA